MSLGLGEHLLFTIYVCTVFHITIMGIIFIILDFNTLKVFVLRFPFYCSPLPIKIQIHQ